MSKISRLTSKVVTLGKNVVGGRGEVAAPEEGGGFADYALVSLHCLRIYLYESYRNPLDLLSEMPRILAEIGLEEGYLPHHSTLVDTKTQCVLDVHCTTGKRHDTQIGWQLAANKGYDWMRLREKLREEDVRPLIKHREFRPIGCAHNARIDGSLYGQRALSETVFSTIKRTLGHAVRARAWYREFREVVLMCAVYNIKRVVKQ